MTALSPVPPTTAYTQNSTAAAARAQRAVATGSTAPTRTCSASRIPTAMTLIQPRFVAAIGSATVARRHRSAARTLRRSTKRAAPMASTALQAFRLRVARPAPRFTWHSGTRARLCLQVPAAGPAWTRRRSAIWCASARRSPIVEVGIEGCQTSRAVPYWRRRQTKAMRSWHSRRLSHSRRFWNDCGMDCSDLTPQRAEQ